MKKYEDYKDIPGWGIDADPENDPTYPVKNWTGDDHRRIDYERSEQQPDTVEILVSNERPAITRVYGNTVPPSGLSGKIRRYAFQHSEDRYRHWIPLILADRVNVAEGLLGDLKTGYFPNFIKERGLAVEWRYNRAEMLKKATAAVLAGVILVALARRKK